MVDNVIHRIFGKANIPRTLCLAGDTEPGTLIIDARAVENDGPGSRYSIVARMPGCQLKIFASMLCAVNGYVTWPIARDAAAMPGRIEIEIQARNGADTRKSPPWPFFIAPSLSDGCRRDHCHHHGQHRPECPQPDDAAELLDEIARIDMRISDVNALIDSFDPDTAGGPDRLRVVRFSDKTSLPAIGDESVMYVIEEYAYLWRANPPGYACIGLDPDIPTPVIIYGGEET